MAEHATIDLENELTCAVCTEILYQPLTLLDCLHTFCGSCLKIWFESQAASSRNHVYTCPACREKVRATSSDAKINTLLDMYLLANPGKVKSEEEKKELSARYTKGDSVLPTTRTERRQDEAADTDRRMVEELREMNLRESHARDHRQGYERGIRHRQRSRESRHGQQDTATTVENSVRARNIERQSSLRSVISTEELDTDAMVNEIMRQISEEGLLEGIDPADPAQQDELVQKIYEAYRRRVERERRSSTRRTSTARNESIAIPGSRTRTGSSRSRSNNRSALTTATASRSPGDQSSARPHIRSSSAADESHASNPPVTRPHLLDADAALHIAQPRRSNESRRHTSPGAARRSTVQQMSRSATDLSNSSNSDMPPTQTTRPAETNIRRNTLSRGETQTEGEVRRSNETRPRPGSRSNNLAVTAQRNLDVSPRRPAGQRPSNIEISATQASSAPTTPLLSITASEQESQNTLNQPVAGLNQAARSKLYKEISIKCDRCGREHIEYELHEFCSICKEGQYSICHRCYRQGKGCPHWFGFGDLAWYQFRQGSSHQDPPHALVGRKYTRPRSSHSQTSGTSSTILTSEDPTKRLQSGAFCSRCHKWADDCFWKCSECNEGEWGYCNECVNTGFCCSHPLLPLANASSSAFTSGHPEASFAPITSPSMLQAYPATNSSRPAQYRPLTFSTNCNICHYPIQPSQSRFHCYTCSNGNYDICNLCYARLLDSGRISRENGDKGWRKCPNNHRMVKTWFEDSPLGQRRVIVNPLVGGLCFEDSAHSGEWSWVEGEQRRTRSLAQRMFDESESSTNEPKESTLTRKFPSDGGAGFHVRATHAWLPDPAAKDELSFPRGAEIWEAQEISADWYYGSYAGECGLFPVNHVVVLGRVVS